MIPKPDRRLLLWVPSGTREASGNGNLIEGGEGVAKRGNGEGTIRRRNDGRWEARYTVQTLKGPKQKSVFGKTRKEVNEKLTKVQADRNQGLVFDSENMTVGEYLDKWLKTAVRHSVRQSTFERNQQIVQGHIKPAIGKVKLD